MSIKTTDILELSVAERIQIVEVVFFLFLLTTIFYGVLIFSGLKVYRFHFQ